MAQRAFLEEVLLSHFEARQLQTQAVTAMPLYPTEAVLWDDNQVPDMHYTGALLPRAAQLVPALCAAPSQQNAGVAHSCTWHDKACLDCLMLRSMRVSIYGMLSRGDVPGAAQAQPAVPDHHGLPAAQLPPLPPGGHLRDPGGHC